MQRKVLTLLRYFQLSSLQKQLDTSRKASLKGQENSRASEVKIERLQVTIRTMQTQVPSLLLIPLCHPGLQFATNRFCACAISLAFLGDAL